MFALGFIIVLAMLLSPSISHRFNRVSSQKNPIFERSSHQPHPPSRWSEVVLVKMHYDCSGRLVHKEVSDIQTKEDDKIKDKLEEMYRLKDIFRDIEDEKRPELFNMWNSKTPLEYAPQQFDWRGRFNSQQIFPDSDKKDSFKNWDTDFSFDEIMNSNTAIEKDQTKPVGFVDNTQQKEAQQEIPFEEKLETKESTGFADFTRSQLGRFRKPPPKALLDRITEGVMPTVAPSSRTSRPSVRFEDDRIIDSPIIPCPDGQNFDLAGRCKAVFLVN